jgi:hypothetical protein
LLPTGETSAADDLQRARAQLLRAQIAFASSRGSDARPLLLQAARDLQAVDTTLARATYLEALSSAMFAGRCDRGGGVVEVSKAALAGPPPPSRRETVLPPEEARWLWFASWIAVYLWDDHAWTVLSTRHLDLVRETGGLTALPFVLTNRSSVYAFFGELGPKPRRTRRS